ncbi:MAG: glutamine--fructose-6-phosphate transaminase (isomerizing) [bacterium]|nr:glutamine--fructose-6-phosphate transaminase (isomerizing) [bacterium]
MCGIVGYIGKEDALPFLMNGLKKMEYRGYDSAGVCVLEKDKLRAVKQRGKVSELEKVILNPRFQILDSHAGIAHTRWATHGLPNEINAHPHLDCKKEIAIVHNGIIENYSALKELLKKEGHKFVSQTDSEVLAHLIEKFYVGNLEEAVMKALKLVEGTFGLLVMHTKEKKIIAAKKGSPLVLGIGKGEMLVASDVSALVHKTKKVIYLDDNEIASITPAGYTIKNMRGRVVDKKIHEVAMTVQQIEKRGFKHFMLKEIFEQPEAIENTLRGRVVNGNIKLSINFDITRIQRIIITACGTSWHSALMGKYLIENIAGIPVEVDYASELRYRNPIMRQNDLVVVLSQSGETADTLAALQLAKEKGATTLGIVNVVGSTIAREVDSGIYLHAGPEIGVASTKAFTCQVTALVLLALHLKQKGSDAESKKIIRELQMIPQKISEILKTSGQIRSLAKKFKDRKHFLYLGRNLNFPVALEGALKLKEISYIHAEGYPAAEMKHGPIALIDENMPVVFIAPKDEIYKKVLSNMEEVKARGGNIIAIVNHNDPAMKKLAKHVIQVPKTIDVLSPLVNVIPLQLLAYHIADLKGLNVDRPRNLAKSVTVE